MSNPYSRIRRAKRRSEAAILFEASAPEALPTAKPCDTCGGTGTVGGFMNGENGYQDDPCPDCDGSGVARMQEG